MTRGKTPVTPAVRLLRTAKVPFTDHLYAYEERGGTAVSARELGVDEHTVVKTLVMEETILNLPRIYINGGKRGYLVGIDPKDVAGILKPTLVRVAI